MKSAAFKEECPVFPSEHENAKYIPVLRFCNMHVWGPPEQNRAIISGDAYYSLKI